MRNLILQLEWLLILRNRRALLLLLIGSFAPLPLLWIAPQVYEISPVQTALLALVLTAGTSIAYGAYLIAWEGSFFNRIMTLQFSIRTYLNAKFLLLFLLCLMQSLLAILLSAIFISKTFSTLLAGALLYNVGINLPLTVHMGQFNLKKINLETSSIVFTEQSGWNALHALLFFLPALIIAFSVQLYTHYTNIPFAFAGAGLSGILLYWAFFNDYTVRCFRRRRYKLIEAYNGKSG